MAKKVVQLMKFMYLQGGMLGEVMAAEIEEDLS